MTITKPEVLKMDFPAITAAIKNPETSAGMQSLLRDREVAVYVSEKMMQHKQALEARENTADRLAATIPPTTEELAEQANAMVEEAPTETVTEEPPVLAPSFTPDSSAEDVEFRDNGITPHRDGQGKIYKLVQEYQVRDEDGTSIGRPTHLEAKNLLELMGKQRKAHEEAVRFGYRMKKQKLQFKSDQPKSLLTPEQIQEAARIALEEKSGDKAVDVVREILRNDFEKQEVELRNRIALENGRAIAVQFKMNHVYDYYDCDANKKALKDYFDANPDIEFTLDAVEFAFQDLTREGKLVPLPNRGGQTRVDVAANPAPPTSSAAPAAAITAPPIAAVETAPVVPVEVPPSSQAAPTTTVTTPAVAANNAAPAARRPGVNGGLPPGTLSAQRPGTPDPALTRKEFLQKVAKMDGKVMAHKVKTDPQFVKQLRAAGIQV
jgi:hypothetical protein